MRNIRPKLKAVLVRNARPLIDTKLARRVAENNPKIVVLVKKASKRIFGGTAGNPEPDIPPGDSFNQHLAENYTEHTALLGDNKTYWYEKESPNNYKRAENDPRIVAIYLPQFHPFRENNEAWGKGFTEWTNVTASTPRFVGQQQPVLPSDLGFYDLRLPQVLKDQTDMAKKYGIYGFQLYYYWFSGKKVMDLPINTILKNKEWDFHFSICWANENWTRKWDGGDNEIIFEQKNLPDDPLSFIEDVSPILNDDRYILENDKPILTVYRVELLDDPKRYVDTWRKYFKDKFKKELWLVGHTYDVNVNPKDFGFDATMDFTPIASLQPTLKPWVDDRKYITHDFINNHKLLDSNWRGNIIDFRFIAKQEIDNLERNTNIYKTVSPSWSNEARRKGNDSYTFYNSSPEIFANWLDRILNYEVKMRHRNSPIVFINAWNEWAEAAMIEPSMHLGHNSLLRIAETISKYSTDKDNKILFPSYKFKYSSEANLAVIIHLYYPDMWPEFDRALKNIDTPFDLYVSISDEHEDININKISSYHKNTNLTVVPNRGRDVLPFVMVANRIRSLGNYDYILKLHTKKSPHRKDGNSWFNDVLSRLLPSVGVESIIKQLSKPSTGSIGPSGHVVSLSRHMGGNRAIVSYLTESMTGKVYKSIVEKEDRYPFFGSTMFWCRMDFLDPLLDLYLMPSDFQSEDGQIDGTMAHATERILGKVLHKIGRRKMYSVDSNSKIVVVSGTYDIKYKFAE